VTSRVVGEGRLSDEDRLALKRTASDLSDIDPATLERAREGFRNAYEVAQKVVDGLIDPLSDWTKR
jgi:hypothetical protein